jgi:2-keto-4-pentenoate hydratase/2-oxohepta-3-ene-1,7-dioic acid hydratase in catechol pathway
MQLVTFTSSGQAPHVGALLPPSTVLDLTTADPDRAEFTSMLSLIASGDSGLAAAHETVKHAQQLPGSLHPLSEVELLAPIPRPVKSVYCVGLNFRSHVEQNARALGQEPEIPETPLFFSKPVTSVVGPGDPIRHDGRLTSKLDYEVELALVIGRQGTWISADQASSYIFGFTALNDVSARDLQFRSSQFLYGKGQDSYCPIGPLITSRDEMPPLENVLLRLLVNGEVRQEEIAGHMLFTPEEAVVELSKGITLEPGDIISLGTPGGCGYQMAPPRFLEPGDVVECDITGIGRLTNPVIDVSPDAAAPTSTALSGATQEMEDQQ